jgi:uncharacterized membrane protein
MKSSMILGIVLIVLGLAGLVFQTVTYTTQEKVADIGSLHVTAAKEKTVPIPAIAGGLALAAGVVLVVTGSRKG